MNHHPPVGIPKSEAERIDELCASLRRHHAVAAGDIRLVRAPLRICPLGAHIDHQRGIVTGCAIDQSILLAFAPGARAGRVEVQSLNFEHPVRFDLDDIPAYQPGDWGNYVRGAATALKRRYAIDRGLIGVIGSEMPVGGLSSSAAVTVAYLLALQAVNGLKVSSRQNIDLVSEAEQGYIGLQNGILDQTVILFSAQDSLTCIDCERVAIEQAPAGCEPDTFEILVAYSGMSTGLMATGYNERVAECQAAARLLLEAGNRPLPADVRLRAVPEELFRRKRRSLPAKLQRRAQHFFGEMERVRAGIEAWKQGDIALLGRRMSESGASSVRFYECGSPQLISLYNILVAIPGVYGARFSGAGFRGSCIALVDPARRQSIAEAVHAAYPAAHPEDARRYSLHFCRPAARATLIEGNF